MSDFREELCSELKKYKDVIIYGYEDIARCLLNYIIDMETSIRLSDYSGRVKYFAKTSQSYNSNRKEIKGIKIKSIYDLQEYAGQALVIVATKEIHHRDIGRVLQELGFQHVRYLLHENYCLLRESVENHQTIVNTNLQQYHLNHRMKLGCLREKIRRGGKARVFFMTHDSAVFGCASLYWKMMEDELFDPYIYVVSRRDVGYKNFFTEVQKDIQFFERHGYRVISGYDEWGNPKDLHFLRPDILFYDLPKMYEAGRGSYNRLEQLNWEYLTCYVPYGLLMVDSFYYHYHLKCIRGSWKFFVDTPASFKRVLADSDFNAFNTVLGGYPKFDEYYAKDAVLPEKLRNGKPVVIYAPHHSLFVTNNFATFDLYKDIMLTLVKQNPEINFVFKPHPLLKYRVDTASQEGKINFTGQDYADYLAEWDGQENGLVVTGGDYIKLFRECRCMITDCGSFIGEFFPSQKPCIYLFNPRKERQEEVYTPLASKILETYYIVHNQEELLERFRSIALEGADEKRDSRKALAEAEFQNIGHAGADICEYLKQEIQG